jgi:hypothetical protein
VNRWDLAEAEVISQEVSDDRVREGIEAVQALGGLFAESGRSAPDDSTNPEASKRVQIPLAPPNCCCGCLMAACLKTVGYRIQTRSHRLCRRLATGSADPGPSPRRTPPPA